MTSSDDGLRGIQFKGKQLVFLFMAVTVVSVVIFLCGVLVGRGVQSRATPTETTAADDSAPAADPSIDATADVAPPPPVEPVGATKAEDLVYSENLQTTGPASETLGPRSDSRRAPAAAPGKAAKSAQPSPPTADATAATPATATVEIKPLPPEPKGDGMAIQVAALRGRSEAEAVVTRLKGKGYGAYIVPSLAGQPAGFRVRVGKFKTRAEAEKVAARLEQEEQFKPWITR